MPKPGTHSNRTDQLPSTGSDGLTLADLAPDPRNARQHNDRNVEMIETSLREVGAARSIVVDEDGTVLAGNATLAAARTVGIERVRIIETDGAEVIAVRRSGLTPEQKRRLALFDNRSAELAAWDSGVIASFLNETDLSALWEPDELAELIGEPPEVDFPAFDETAAESVAYVDCPNCGHRFPR